MVIENPLVTANSGRPATSSQRFKSKIEIISKKKKKNGIKRKNPGTVRSTSISAKNPVRKKVKR